MRKKLLALLGLSCAASLFIFTVALSAEDGAPIKHLITRSPSGDYHLDKVEVTQFVADDPRPGLVVGSSLRLLDKDGKVLSQCLTPEDEVYVFEEGRFQSKVYWNAEESLVAISSGGRIHHNVDIFSIRNGQIVPWPEVNYSDVPRNKIKNCTGVRRPFAVFDRWLSPDSFEVKYFGYAYIGDPAEEANDLSDGTKYQEFSYSVKVQISAQEVRILEAKVLEE